MNAAEIQSLYERGVREYYSETRGDEHFAHAKDLTLCLLNLRARFEKKPMIPIAAANRAMMELGHKGEEVISAGLSRALDADDFDQDVLIWMQVDDDGTVRSGRLHRASYMRPHVLIDELTDEELNPARTLVGHVDAVARKDGAVIVGEWKTKKDTAGGRPSWFDEMQAVTYALAVNATACVIAHMDRRTGVVSFYDVDIAAKRDEVLQRARAVLAARATPPPPDTEPPFAFMCKTCDFGGCARNVNPQRNSLEGVF